MPACRRTIPVRSAYLPALMDWLCRAQDCSRNADGGVARDYSLINGWASSYPGDDRATSFRHFSTTPSAVAEAESARARAAHGRLAGATSSCHAAAFRAARSIRPRSFR